MDIAQFGSMFIQLTQGYFTPGQQVNGTINLNLIQPVPGATQIYLVVAGVENVSLNQRQVYYTYSGTGKNRRRKTHYRNIRHNETQPVCNYRFPVYTFPGSGMAPGMYTFPFTFVLDANMPSSFALNFANPPGSKEAWAACFANVEYSLMAFIDDNNPNTPPIRYVQKVIVNQADVANLGVHKCNIKKENTCCCCFGKGSTALTSYFEKNEYCPGETAYILTEVDNSASSDPVQSVTVTFSQRCTFKAGAYTHQHNVDHQQSQINGVPEGQKLPTQRMEVRLVDKSGQNVTPTSRGRLVKNEYVLLNRAHVDTTCNCDVPHAEATMQMTIRSPDMVYQQWVPPQNWAPQAMPVAQFQMGGQYQQQTFPPELMMKPPVVAGQHEEDGDSEDDAEM